MFPVGLFVLFYFIVQDIYPIITAGITFLMCLIIFLWLEISIFFAPSQLKLLVFFKKDDKRINYVGKIQGGRNLSKNADSGNLPQTITSKCSEYGFQETTLKKKCLGDSYVNSSQKIISECVCNYFLLKRIELSHLSISISVLLDHKTISTVECFDFCCYSEKYCHEALMDNWVLQSECLCTPCIHM